MTTSLLLLSGGLDSVVLAGLVRPGNALFVDYGQVTAEAERAAARFTSHTLGLVLQEARLDLSSFGSGELFGVPQRADAPTPEWIPFRNQFLVTAAASHAFQLGLSEVLIGIAQGDGERHADGSSDFVSAIDALTRLQEGGVSVSAPLTQTSLEAAIAGAALPSEVLLRTHSCQRSNRACGVCSGCTKRTHHLSALLRGGG